MKQRKMKISMTILVKIKQWQTLQWTMLRLKKKKKKVQKEREMSLVVVVIWEWNAKRKGQQGRKKMICLKDLRAKNKIWIRTNLLSNRQWTTFYSKSTKPKPLMANGEIPSWFIRSFQLLMTTNSKNNLASKFSLFTLNSLVRVVVMEI